MENTIYEISLGGDSLLPNINGMVQNSNQPAKVITKSKISFKGDSLLSNINEMTQNSNQLSEVIAKVIDLVTRLLDSEMAGVALYNQETNELVLQKPAFRMTNDEVLAAYRVPLGYDYNTANVYITGEPYISNDSLHDSRLRQKFVKLFKAKNCITIPLRIENRRIGILHVTNKKSGIFTQGDLEILTFLASHLALFIDKAIIYERERKQAKELVALNAKLQTHQVRLEKLFAVHNNLIEQVLNEDGMSFMIRTLSELLSATVFVEDSHFNHLISSHPEEIYLSTRDLLQEQGKIHMLNKGQTVKSAPYLHCDRQVVRFTAPIGKARYTLGYLSMVIEAENEASDLRMIAFEQGAMALALEMMKGRIKVEAESRFRSELLDDLFSGKYEDKESILQRADIFQYNLKKSSRVIVISLDANEGKKLTESCDYSLYQDIQNHVLYVIQNFFPGSLAVGKRNCVEALLPVVLSLSREEMQQRLNEVREQLAIYFQGRQVLVGVGCECQYFEDYHHSYRQARKALEIGRFITQRSGVVFYDQLGIYSLLFEISDLSLLKNLVADKLGPMLEYDVKKDSFLADTLEVYLKTGGSLKETAQTLFIHVATLKYRLGRIQEFLNVDLRKSENHFDLQLALFAHRFLTKID